MHIPLRGAHSEIETDVFMQVGKIRAGLKTVKKSAEEERVQLAACYKIATVMTVFALSFLCQVCIDAKCCWPMQSWPNQCWPCHDCVGLVPPLPGVYMHQALLAQAVLALGPSSVGLVMTVFALSFLYQLCIDAKCRWPMGIGHRA